jgi:hypothetical protein
LCNKEAGGPRGDRRADVGSTLGAPVVNRSRLSGGESAARSRDTLTGITRADNYIQLPISLRSPPPPHDFYLQLAHITRKREESGPRIDIIRRYHNRAGQGGEKSESDRTPR